MSTINKKPFIKSLLESMSDEDLNTLSTLIDGGGNQTPLRRTANPIDTEAIPHISEDDMGVHLCNLTINYTNFLGYLIYNDDYCVLISFTDAQVLKLFDLTNDVTRPNTVDEAINILEMRSALFEAKGGSGGGSDGSGSGEIKEFMDVWLFNEDQMSNNGYQNEYDTSLNFAQLYQNHYNGNSKIWVWYCLYDNRYGYLDDASGAKQTALLLRSIGLVIDGTDAEKYDISFINSDNTLLITMTVDVDTMTVENYDERHSPNQIDIDNLAYIEAWHEDGDPYFNVSFNERRKPEWHINSEGDSVDSIWRVNININDVYDFIAPEDAGYCSFGNDLKYEGLASITFYNLSDTAIECRINCGSFELYYEAYYDSEEEVWTNQYLYIWGSAAGAGNGGGGGGSGVTYHLDLSQFGDLPRASYGMSNPPHPNKYTYGIAEILKNIQYYFDDDYANEYALESQFYITDPNNYQERCPHSDISFLLIDGASDDDAWDALCAIDASDSIEISGIIDYSSARPFEGILENNIITLKRAGSRYYDENIYLEGDQYPVRGATFISDIFQDAEHNNSYDVSPVKVQVIAKTSWDYGYSFGGVYLTIRYIYPTVWTEDYSVDHALKCYVEAMALRKAKVTLRCEIYPRAMHSMLQEHNLYTFDDNGQTTNTQNVDFSNYCHYSLKYFDSTSGDLKDAIFYSNGSNYNYKDKSTNADLPYDTIGYAILEFDFSNLTFTDL